MVDLAIKNGGSFHSVLMFLYVHQRVVYNIILYILHIHCTDWNCITNIHLMNSLECDAKIDESFLETIGH